MEYRSDASRRALSFTLRLAAFSLLFTLLTILLGLLFRPIYEEAEARRSAKQSSLSSVSLPLFLIDPGHGGRDGGAVSITGTLEKDLNLSLSRTLGLLFDSIGWPVLLSRAEDILPDGGGSSPSFKTRDLKARLDLMKAHPEAIFVSIHMNTFPQAQYHGLQVYYSVNDPESHVLAETIRETVVSLLQPDNKRECKPAGSSIFLLYKAPVPAVLVECGFLSNPDEAARLDTRSYRDALAVSLFSSLTAYSFSRQ